MARRRWLPPRRSRPTPPLPTTGNPLVPPPRRFRSASLLRRPRPVATPWPQAIAAAPQLPLSVARPRRPVPLLGRGRPVVQPVPAPVVVTTQALPPQLARRRAQVPVLRRRGPLLPPAQQASPQDDVQRVRVRTPVRLSRGRSVVAHLAVQGKTHLDPVRPKARPLPPRRARLIQPPWSPPAAVSVPAPPTTIRATKRATVLLRGAARAIQPPWQPQALVNPPLVPAAPRGRHSLAVLAVRHRVTPVPPLPAARSAHELVQRTKLHPPPRRRTSRQVVTPVPPHQHTPPAMVVRTRVKPTVVVRPAKLNHPPWKTSPAAPALVFNPPRRTRPWLALRHRDRLVEAPVGPYIAPVHPVVAVVTDGPSIRAGVTDSGSGPGGAMTDSVGVLAVLEEFDAGIVVSTTGSTALNTALTDG